MRTFLTVRWVIHNRKAIPRAPRMVGTQDAYGEVSNHFSPQAMTDSNAVSVAEGEAEAEATGEGRTADMAENRGGGGGGQEREQRAVGCRAGGRADRTGVLEGTLSVLSHSLLVLRRPRWRRACY